MNGGRDESRVVGAPLVVTLGFDPETFARLDALRRRHFPPGRNLVPAHLSIFHRLPSEARVAVEPALSDAARSTGPIPLRFGELKRLGSALAIPVEAPGLVAVRRSLAAGFSSWLTPQDRQPFRPHVTILNKADPETTAMTYDWLRGTQEPRGGLGAALLLWAYRGGPWESLSEFRFSADSGTTAPGRPSAV